MVPQTLHIVDDVVPIGIAAGLLGVTQNTLRNWEKRGIIHPYRIGPRSDRRYAVEEVLAIRGYR